MTSHVTDAQDLLGATPRAAGFRWEDRPRAAGDERIGLWLVLDIPPRESGESAAIRWRAPRGHRFLQAFTRLPSELSVDVSQRTRQLEAIQVFATQYGWLGRGEQDPQGFYGEPLGAWLEEIEKLRDLLATVEDLRASKTGARQQRSFPSRFRWSNRTKELISTFGPKKLELEYTYGRSCPELPAESVEWELVFNYGANRLVLPADSVEKEFGVNRHAPEAKWRPLAGKCVEQIIEREIAGRLRIAFPAPLRGSPEVVPVNLLGALYWQLARELHGGRLADRMCKMCLEVFTPARKGHDFCSGNCRQRYKRHRELHSDGEDATP